MKSHWESPTKGIGGGMALFWESLQSFRAEVTLSFSPAWIRGDEVGLWEEFKGFSAKASAWLLLQSAHSTAGHKLPEPGVRCWVCVCLERSITPWQSCLVLLSAPSLLQRLGQGVPRAAGTFHWERKCFHWWNVSTQQGKHCKGPVLHIVWPRGMRALGSHPKMVVCLCTGGCLGLSSREMRLKTLMEEVKTLKP